MKIETIDVKLKGIAPLIMSNGQAASPFSAIGKTLSGLTAKRKRTDSDNRTIGLVEWASRIYGTEPLEVIFTGKEADGIKGGGAPCIPGDNVERMIVLAADNRAKKAFKAGVFLDGDALVRYEGPKTIEGLFGDPRFMFSKLVKVGQAKVLRTRPIFREWMLTFQVQFLPNVVNRQAVVDVIENAGSLVGLGDWRPKYGRYVIDSVS